MSLVISCITNDFVTQVSDRRLSRGGKPISDEYNKAIVLEIKDARLLIGMVGLASYSPQGKPKAIVRRRIMELIGEAAQPDYEIENILDRLSVLFTEEFRGLHDITPEDRRLSIIFTGFQYNREGVPYPRVWLVSNCELLEGDEYPEAQDEFVVDSRLDPDVGHASNNFSLVCMIGAHDSIDNDDIHGLQDSITKSQDPLGAISQTTDLIRKVSAAEPSVGGNMSSVFLLEQGGAKAFFHRENKGDEIIVPSYGTLLSQGTYWQRPSGLVL